MDKRKEGKSVRKEDGLGKVWAEDLGGKREGAAREPEGIGPAAGGKDEPPQIGPKRRK